MSLSRHFQFMLSQNEAAACRRFSESPSGYNDSPLWRNDYAHLRNVAQRAVICYDQAKPDYTPKDRKPMDIH